MARPALTVTSCAGLNKLSTYVFIWLLVVLTLSLLLIHLRHRRRITAEIREGVADAREILDSSDEGIIVTNDSGKIIKCNQVAETIFGYKAKNLIGKNFLLLLPTELHMTHQHTMSGSAANATCQTHEFLARNADGSRFPLSLTVKPARQHGKPVFLGMFRDISTLKRAEAISWKNQQLMEFLLESSPIVFYTCDVEKGYTFTYVSPNVESLFGYKPETIVDASAFWLRYVHPDDHDQLQLSRQSQLKQGRDEIEYRLKLPGGNYRWVSDSHTMVHDENGKPALLIGRWTDIHKRKVTETELALKEESLHASLKCAKLATWGWLINTGEMSWSGQIDEKLGVSKKELADFDDFCAITHPEDRQSLVSSFRQCLVENQALDIEYRVLWPDQSIRWIHLMGELINDESGSPLRIAGVLSDVTDRKHLRLASRRVANQVS
jgi:PAS domain S-box-containing protein